MRQLPPPGTFAEGQRYIYGLLGAAAGTFCARPPHSWSRCSCGAAGAPPIVTIFGWSLGGFIAAMIVVIVGLLAGVPVGRFKVSATRDGASIEAEEQP